VHAEAHGVIELDGELVRRRGIGAADGGGGKSQLCADGAG
jgi:hypothetical protein